MTMEHLKFLDSISFLPMALRKLPEVSDSQHVNPGTHILSTHEIIYTILDPFQALNIMASIRELVRTEGIHVMI